MTVTFIFIDTEAGLLMEKELVITKRRFGMAGNTLLLLIVWFVFIDVEKKEN